MNSLNSTYKIIYIYSSTKLYISGKYFCRTLPILIFYNNIIKKEKKDYVLVAILLYINTIK